MCSHLQLHDKVVSHVNSFKTHTGTLPGSRGLWYCLMTGSEEGLQQGCIHWIQYAFCVPRILLGHTNLPGAGRQTHWGMQPTPQTCFCPEAQRQDWEPELGTGTSRHWQQLKKENFANEPQSLRAWSNRLFPNILAESDILYKVGKIFFSPFGARKFCI